MRTLKALLLAVGIFIGLEVVLFIASSIVLAMGVSDLGSPTANTSASSNTSLSIAITNYGSVLALALSVIGGIVYGVQARQPH